MNKGYRIVEPEKMDSLLKKPQYFELAVAVYHYLISELRVELEKELANAELHVIPGGFFGNYPMLGIHYETDRNDTSLEDTVETTIDRLLSEKSIVDLIKYATQSGINWREKTDEIMNLK